MADNKKYYYMRLKENFFDSPELKTIESMRGGYKYSNILLKLYLLSLRDGGRLTFKQDLPYDTNMLSKLTGFSKIEIENALKIFKKFKLIEVLDTGTIYMMDIQTLIGKSSNEADRQREYQAKIASEKQSIMCKKSNKESNEIPTPETALQIEKEIELNKETDPEKKLKTAPLTPQGETCDGTVYSKDFENVWNLYPRKADKLKAFKAWNKINPSEELTNKILNAIIHTKATEQWQKESGRFIPHLANWLSNRRWEDEPEKKYNASCDLDQYKRQDIFNNTYSNLKNNPDIKREELPPGINSQEELEALKARLRE